MVGVFCIGYERYRVGNFTPVEGFVFCQNAPTFSQNLILSAQCIILAKRCSSGCIQWTQFELWKKIYGVEFY